MRDYLNGILSIIGAESLTDEEFSSISVTDQNDHLAVYDSLTAILVSRDVVSDMTSRLMYYFQARGIAVSAPALATSNIFVGASLDECN